MVFTPPFKALDASLLSHGGTLSFSLLPLLSPISQSYPGREKCQAFPRAEKGRLSRCDLWRPLAQLAAAMSRSVVNILVDPDRTDRRMDRTKRNPRRIALTSYDESSPSPAQRNRFRTLLLLA